MSPTPFTAEQQKVIRELDKVLLKAKATGLVLRVYDGAILVADVEALRDPRYGEFGEDGHAWLDECTTQVGIGLNADGGAVRRL